MGGSPEWDNRMAESLKKFDLNSPEIKQQFCEYENIDCFVPYFSTTTQFIQIKINI